MTRRAADFREPRREEDHLTRHARTWHAEGEPETHFGVRIDVHRRVGGAPLLLLLHGFPTSSFDWRYLLAQDRQHAAIAFDYPGLGASAKPEDGEYRVARLADLAERLVEEHGEDRSVLLVAHDLGVSVASELIARDLEARAGPKLVGALFLNGAVVPGEAARQFARKVLPRGLRARVGGERHFRHELGQAFSPEHPLDPELAEDEWSLLTHDDGHKVADRVLGYLDVDASAADRWRTAVRQWDEPIRVVWGTRDPVAGEAELEALRSLRPSLDVTELADVGHFPHIEAPGRVLAAVDAFG